MRLLAPNYVYTDDMTANARRRIRDLPWDDYLLFAPLWIGAAIGVAIFETVGLVYRAFDALRRIL
jgi:hypothetical protein